mmetsp:Transcript_22882/g.41492  ORF Transcript_22882/g.41492 Transcript_22882/m.41492 type:complete len:371 (+) Transcript_22882:45-1157(+)
MSSLHVYKRQFAWTGHVYRVHVHESRSVLQWMNRLVNSLMFKRLVFHEDGSICNENWRPVTLAGVQICWRWDPMANCIVIEFLRHGSPLQWRWEKLDPLGDPEELVPGWSGVAHVGQSVYTYSLTLEGVPQPELEPLEVGRLNDSLLCVQGSVALNGEECGPKIASVLSKFKEVLDEDTGKAQQILQSIDRMWVQELLLQSSGELADAVMEAALAVERGEDAESAISNASQRLSEVRTMAFESFQVRADARERVTAAGGVEELRRTLAEGLDKAERSMQPLIAKLSDASSATEVEIAVKKKLRNVTAEYDFISDLKEANANLLVDLTEELDELQEAKFAFSETVMRAAASNPQNTPLQKIADEATGRNTK